METKQQLKTENELKKIDLQNRNALDFTIQIHQLLDYVKYRLITLDELTERVNHLTGEYYSLMQRANQSNGQKKE